MMEGMSGTIGADNNTSAIHFKEGKGQRIDLLGEKARCRMRD